MKYLAKTKKISFPVFDPGLHFDTKTNNIQNPVVAKIFLIIFFLPLLVLS